MKTLFKAKKKSREMKSGKVEADGMGLLPQRDCAQLDMCSAREGAARGDARKAAEGERGAGADGEGQ